MDLLATPTTPAQPTARSTRRITESQRWRYSAGSLASGGFATLPGLVLIYYFTDALGIDPLWGGAVLGIVKLWDVIANPLIGGFSDLALTRSGTRRGLMAIGAILLPISFALVFAVPPDLPTWAKLLWVTLSFLASATGFALFQVPYVTLPAELTSSYTERTRLLSLRVIILTITILAFGAGGPAIRDLFPDNPTRGYLVMGIVAAAVQGIGLAIAATVAPKHKVTAPVVGERGSGTDYGTSRRRGSRTAGTATRAGQRSALLKHYLAGINVVRSSQPFRALAATFMLQGLATGVMLGAAQYAATWVLHNESAVTLLFIALIAPAVLVTPLWRTMADRKGKRATFLAASVLFTVASVSLVWMLWAPGWWVLAPVAVAGCAYAGMQTLPMAMLPDVISLDPAYADPDTDDFDATAQQRSGSYSGVWTAGETLGLAMGSVVMAIMLAISNYVEATADQVVTQPHSAIVGIVLAFSVIPAGVMVLSMASLWRYRVSKEDVDRAREISAHVH